MKRVAPFVKVDKGLEPEVNGVKVMKPITDLGSVLARARGVYVFGTKMRSVIRLPEEARVKGIVRSSSTSCSRYLSEV